MHFSCKISNAILTYLEEKGEDLSPLYDQLSWPMELLRDSSYWLSAPDMESFLEAVLRLPLKASEQNVLVSAGHNGPANHAWGVLDSVLKMISHPQDVFQQPDRFLSYFISPEPPVENVDRGENRISFDLPLPAEQYPHVATYLKAAFESLPTYIGQEPGTCEWKHIHLSIAWNFQQSSIFAVDPGRQISPNLLQNVIEELQKHQLELEEKNRNLQRKYEELDQAHKNLQGQVGDVNPELVATEIVHSPMSFGEAEPGYVIAQNLARLHDYMVRAQQLVTVLSSQGKLTPFVKEIMRRVDWDYVKLQYPRTISESVEHLRKLQTQISPNKKETEVEFHV